MQDWKLSNIIKSKAKNGFWHSNIVGIILIGEEEKEYIYKLSRLPGFQTIWEWRVSRFINENLKGLIHFSRILTVQKLLLDVDEHKRTLPSTKQRMKKQKERLVSIQEMINGISLADHIKYGQSADFIFSSMFQVLASLDAAKKIEFTHYDIHCNNVLMQKENIPKTISLFYLYDFEQPLLVPSLGYRAKIIDYEFAHTSREGISFDSRLDLIDIGITPNSYDPSYDAIRFTLCCNSYAGDVGKLDVCKKIARELHSVINENSKRKFNPDGILKSNGDFLKSFVDSNLGENANKLVLRYYHIIGILMHHCNLPLRKSECDDKDSILQFFEMLSQVSDDVDESCVFLHSFIEGKWNASYSNDWNIRFEQICKRTILYLENYYARLTESISEERTSGKEDLFVPINMIYLLQQEYEIKKLIKPGDIIIHMNYNTTKQFVVTSNDMELEDINSNFDIFRRGRLVKKILKI